jgi:hypothetical protein
MSDQELERRVTILTLILGKVLEDAPEPILAKAMSEFPDILLAELRNLTAVNG